MDTVQQHHSEGEYISSPWVDLGSLHQQQHQAHGHHSHQSSHDYGMYGFVESQQLSTDPAFRIPTSAAQSSYYAQIPQWQFPTSTLQQPFMPQTTSSMSVPSGLPNVASMTAQHTVPTTISAPRRTLTDADRRKMCLYHEENPNVKQTEIGAMFGVERSTVSKVLRQKEKYLNPDDGSKSPVKRSKGKFPDIERALSNWAKNTRSKGQVLTDAMIREKAKFFAQSCGMSEAHFKLNNASWLEKFKMKNNLQMRHNSDAGISKTAAPSRPGHARSISLQSIPKDVASPISTTRSQGSQDSPEGYVDFGYVKSEFGGYNRNYSNSSTTSLSSIYTEQTGGVPIFSPTSPTSPLFSPTESLVSPLFPSQQARLPPIQHQRPRSSTFPSLTMDPSAISPTSSAEILPPRHLNRSSTMNSQNSLSASPIPEEPAAEAEAGSMAPAAPSKEDARRALHLVMSFLKQQPTGAVEADEFVTVGKLLDRFDFGNVPPTEVVPQTVSIANLQ